MALAPWYHRCELLCLAIERTTELLCEVIDRVEVEGEFMYCWAGDHRVTLRETWPSYDGDATIAAGMQAWVGHTPAVIAAGLEARVGHTPARVEIVRTEVIRRATPSRNDLAGPPPSAVRRARAAARVEIVLTEVIPRAALRRALARAARLVMRRPDRV